MISEERKRHLDQFVNGLPAGEDLTSEEVGYIIDNAPRNATAEDWDNALDAFLKYFEAVDRRNGKARKPIAPPKPLPELKCPNGHVLSLTEHLDGTLRGECPKCLTLWYFPKDSTQGESIMLPDQNGTQYIDFKPIMPSPPTDTPPAAPSEPNGGAS